MLPCCRKGEPDDVERYQKDVLNLDRMAQNYKRDKGTPIGEE